LAGWLFGVILKRVFYGNCLPLFCRYQHGGRDDRLRQRSSCFVAKNAILLTEGLVGCDQQATPEQ